MVPEVLYLSALALGASQALVSKNPVQYFKYMVGRFAAVKFLMHVPFLSCVFFLTENIFCT